jgi:hypothetical protein
VLVSPGGTGLGGYYRALARLPGAAAVAPSVGLNGRTMGQYVSVEHRLRYRSIPGRCSPDGSRDRIARRDRPRSARAAILHVQVGSTLAMETITGRRAPGARKLRERVVGVAVTRSSVKPVTDQTSSRMIPRQRRFHVISAPAT